MSDVVDVLVIPDFVKILEDDVIKWLLDPPSAPTGFRLEIEDPTIGVLGLNDFQFSRISRSRASD